MYINTNKKELLQLAKYFYNITHTLISIYDEKENLICTYPDTMWYHVYQAFMGNAPYPITAEEAYNVVKVMMRAHEAAHYQPSVIEYK